MSEESPTSPSPILLDMTQEKEQEAQNLQESPQPQEQQREEHTTSDDKTVSLDSSTPLTSQEEKKEEEVGIISLSSPCVTVAKLPVQDSDKNHDYDFHSQGKEKKIKTESTQDDTPRPFLERVFTDIDCEIGFLNSIIDYYATNEIYPFYDHHVLYDFNKNWLEINATSRQTIDAIVKLRRKYFETKVKMGVNKNFSDPRDQKAFHLAQSIWGCVR
uniref:Glabrous enhancer-binding protein-like DBD domain-containing protein n=1 Tax=Fagus sylvatica TaxID=28930 RepID=A0A2N9FSY9_FAGSY